MILDESSKVVALSGGIGGAKLALGLSRVLPPGALTVIANTADDSEQLGLHVSPDIDTLMYTLAGLADPERGWGRRSETWHCMEALEQLGGETWFRLGDRDLATNIERTHLMRSGHSLTEITARFCDHLGVTTCILPMCDGRVRTRICTQDGTWLAFQDYFVRLRCEPVVREIAYDGARRAKATSEVLTAVTDPQLAAIVICPSNPLLSIEPILAVSGVREAISASPAPKIAVSPIIGGEAVKGPTAKMLRELGIEPSAAAVAERYGSLLDGYIIDEADQAEAARCGVRTFIAPTLMRSENDKDALARATLLAAQAIGTSVHGKRRGRS